MPGQLADRAVLAISGVEAKAFLQGLVTNDISKLAPGAPLYAALLTPQGKILFDFLLSENDGTIFLDCAAGSAQSLLKRLTLYRLRAKVEIATRHDLGVCWGEAGAPDPRLPEFGLRRIGAVTHTDCSAEYLAHRLSLGVPEGVDFGSDKMFALDAGLEELHGVSFGKGCYIGQELTARMKHRGTARKRLLPIYALGGSALPGAGTEVRSGNLALGELVSIYGAHGFALIRLDRWSEVGDQAVHAAESEISISKPAWLASATAT
ncbi:MAG: folate-binding protein YgfZ [Alphaproteobacteria bacterium]|nr:folate-binding protein YgfZ [Alphaproteobacteria bacterium]